MRYLLMLAAAASLAACHNRSDEETGAAPVKDSTAVAADTTQGVPTDSTMGQRPGATDTSAVQQDSTTTTTPTDTTAAPTTDTTTTQQSTSDSSAAGWSDSTSMGKDSSSMSMPADSTNR
jgi:hypothetical protein